MSRYYEITIVVRDCPHNLFYEKLVPIFEDEALAPPDDWNHNSEYIINTFETKLCGGESEDEYCKRVALAIAKVYPQCTLEFNMVYLEELPYETYVFTDLHKLLNEHKGEDLAKAG